MGEYDDYDLGDDDTDTGGGDDGSNLVRDLRKQLNAAKKRTAELDKELGSFRAEKQKQTVADILKSRNVDPRYAEFYSGEDTSKEAVNSWLESKADLFGVGGGDDDVDEETADNVNGVSRAQAAAPPTKIGSDAEKVERLRRASTPEEFQAALQDAGLL